jgi:hypothetical protein
MLVTMTALSDRQVTLKGAKEQLSPAPACSRPIESIACQVPCRRRGAEPVNVTRATVRPEGNNR